MNTNRAVGVGCLPKTTSAAARARNGRPFRATLTTNRERLGRPARSARRQGTCAWVSCQGRTACSGVVRPNQKRGGHKVSIRRVRVGCSFQNSAPDPPR